MGMPRWRSGIVRGIVTGAADLYPKIWIQGSLVSLTELCDGFSIPPNGCQAPGKS